MTSEDKSTQIKVGMFLLIGLLFVGAMVVYFGRLGEGVRKYYTLRVEFPNASGLMRGSEILLAGAKIGRVTNDPTILPDMEGVYVDLRIFENVSIPSASEFRIGSSGLLGDKFIQIDLKKNALKSAPIQPGSTIKGISASGGFEEMTQGAEKLLAELQETVGNINAVAVKINTEVLGDAGVKSVADTLKSLQATSATLAQASAKVDAVVAKVDAAVSDAGTTIKGSKSTMDSAKKAADELQRTLSDIRGLIRDVRQGHGTLGTLISNRETADNLRALVANLRRYGILWYRDGEKGKSPAPER